MGEPPATGHHRLGMCPGQVSGAGPCAFHAILLVASGVPKPLLTLEGGFINLVLRYLLGDAAARQAAELGAATDMATRLAQRAPQIVFLEARGQLRELFGKRSRQTYLMLRRG